MIPTAGIGGDLGDGLICDASLAARTCVLGMDGSPIPTILTSNFSHGHTLG